MTVAQVSKVLASVAKICECGNTVVFDEDGSYIKDKSTGKTMPIHKRDGVYVMDIKVPRGHGTTREDVAAAFAEAGVGEQVSNEVFRRLGADLV